MRKFLGVLFLIFMLYFSLKGCDDRSEEDKIAHRIIYDVSKILERRYQLHYIGMAEAGITNFYTKIGMKFQTFRLLEKNEGRKILIDSANELLKTINSNQKLLAHLQPSPFNLANIELTIFVYNSDGIFAVDPEIGVFSLEDGVISYERKTQKEGYKYGYYVEEIESY